MKVSQLEVYTPEDFRNWLEKHAEKEKRVALVIHKKHTGKKSPSHRELMDEAICYGWIDTTIKRLDEGRYIRHFASRSKNSTWSDNTLSYGASLIKEGRMTPRGMKYYKEGLKKPTHDQNIPKNPDMPNELKKALNRNVDAKHRFSKYAPSRKRMYYRWILSGKRSETRDKRVKAIVEETVKF